MVKRHALVKKFCRFNFVSISWKSNSCPNCQDILGFFEKAPHYVLRSAGVWFSVSLFSPSLFDLFCLFVCLFSFHSCTQDTNSKAELDHIQFWLSKDDWIPKPISLQKANEGRQKIMHLPGAATVSSAFSFSFQFNCVTKSQVQIEWYDLLIHSSVVLNTSRSIFFQAVTLKTKLLLDFLHKLNLNFLKGKG